jgi:hypothetical protein
MCVGIEPYPYIGSGVSKQRKEMRASQVHCRTYFPARSQALSKDPLTTRAGASVNAFTRGGNTYLL